jgi:beta-lactamase class A
MPSPTPFSRRSLLKAGVAVPVGGLLHAGTPGIRSTVTEADSALPELHALETRYDARLGVYAQNAVTGRTITYRHHERFAMCSLFKTLSAAQVLRDYDRCGEFLDRLIRYTEADLVEHSPITAEHVATGMPVRDLCAAAICYGDNTAANLLLEQTAGPPGVTEFCRSIGDRSTRLDRWETELNTAVPGDLRDTTTPSAIGGSYQRLVLGCELSPPDRRQLTAWLKANTTSTHRFKAGLPDDWILADKTGSGGYGTANDVGVAWTPDRTPIVLAVLSSKADADAVIHDELIADTARLLAHRLV